jgi:hemerythrin superfamily protein
MNAIELLTSQHREVEELFASIEIAASPEQKEKLFEVLADKLAVHLAIEEHQFYPAAKAKGTENMLFESLEEHLGIKRVLTDLLDSDEGDETFDAKLKVLKDQVNHHVEEEEQGLFPNVKKFLDETELNDLGKTMHKEQVTLEEKGEARLAISDETDAAAPLL